MSSRQIASTALDDVEALCLRLRELARKVDRRARDAVTEPLSGDTDVDVSLLEALSAYRAALPENVALAAESLEDLVERLQRVGTMRADGTTFAGDLPRWGEWWASNTTWGELTILSADSDRGLLLVAPTGRYEDPAGYSIVPWPAEVARYYTGAPTLYNPELMEGSARVAALAKVREGR